MKVNRLIYVFTILLGITCSVHGQKAWSLQECIAYAFQHSLDLEQNGYTNQMNEINLTQSRKSRYPNLFFGGNVGIQIGRNDNPLTGTRETLTGMSNGYSLSSRVPIFNGFQIQNSIKQAELDLMASQLNLESNKSNIALAVANAYLSALRAQETVKDNQASRALNEKQLARIDKLISAGSVPKNDRLNILAQISAAEQQIIASENNVNIALLNLMQSMNYSETEEIVIQSLPEIPFEDDPFQITVSDVYAKAKATFLRANDLQYQSAEKGIDIAKGAKYPSIDASAGISTSYFNSNKFDDDPYFDQLSDQLGYFVGINLNVPIFDNYSSQAGIERAKVNLAMTKNQNDRSEQVLKTNVQQSLTDARSAKKQMESAEVTLEAQRAAFDNAEKRFELGAINSFDLVNVNNQLNTAQINYTIAKFNYLFQMKILDIYQGKPVSLD